MFKPPIQPIEDFQGLYKGALADPKAPHYSYSTIQRERQ